MLLSLVSTLAAAVSSTGLLAPTTISDPSLALSGHDGYASLIDTENTLEMGFYAQTQDFTGADRDIEVDVRVIAATNKDLRKEIEKGNFREDLYHRLAVIVVRVPALRDHAGDIPALVDHFIRTIADEYGTAPKPIERQALERLQRMPWTGNIRELHNVIERLTILSGERITEEDVKRYAV